VSEPVLPAWADTLRVRYLSGEGSMFLLHGNVRDLVPWREGSGAAAWLDLRGFLERFLGRTRDLVAYHNVSTGLQFADRSQEQRFRRVVDTRRALRGDGPMAALPHSVDDTLDALEMLLLDPGHASALILDYAEMVAPNADVAFMSEADKSSLVTLRRWSTEPGFLATDNLVLLITEQLSDVSRRLLASPQLVTVRVPFPEESERLAFLADHDAGVPTSLSREQLGVVSAGLTLVQLRSVLQMAAQRGEPVDFASVMARKKTLIEQECHGLVELVAPRHDLSHVGGMEEVKATLRRVSEAVQAGAVHRVPMGMIFVGPMGTGKTFVAEAFAASSGLTCLTLKNFRDRWVGSTEANLEKVLDLVDALGYVLLIIDEAERALAGGDNDGGVGSRVIARLKAFMSDTSHRGRVVVLMMTNRPDKLDVDLKRPGRFDLKIPFFFPETDEDRTSILRALVRKNRLTLEDGVELAAIAPATAGHSGAELEAVLLAAASRAAIEGRTALSAADLEASAADVIPSRDVHMLAYMELLAVFECSSRAMLPERYAGLETSDVHARLDEVRARLGRRAL
jgi:transitional endoplasmic reticulum ATPase